MRKFCIVILSINLMLFAFAGGSEPLEAFLNPDISIMSYNIKMLPRGAVFIKHHPVIRARVLPEVLIKESSDVIVFQEAFDGKAMRIIKRKLKPVYPYFAGWKNRKVITYKRAGGVLMFSKYPMKELESITYSQCKGIDCLANKGSLLVEVEHPKKKFQLLGTHMQAGGGPIIKANQHDEAGALLKKYKVKGIPQFAAGDFNTHKVDTVLYPHLLKSLDAEDGEIYSELKFSSDHLLNDMDSYNPNRRNLIDFILMRSNGWQPHKAGRFIIAFEKQWSKKHKSLSDHNAVVLKMNL